MARGPLPPRVSASSSSAPITVRAAASGLSRPYTGVRRKLADSPVCQLVPRASSAYPEPRRPCAHRCGLVAAPRHRRALAARTPPEILHQDWPGQGVKGQVDDEQRRPGSLRSNRPLNRASRSRYPRRRGVALDAPGGSPNRDRAKSTVRTGPRSRARHTIDATLCLCRWRSRSAS